MSKVAFHFLERLSDPSSKEGIKIHFFRNFILPLSFVEKWNARSLLVGAWPTPIPVCPEVFRIISLAGTVQFYGQLHYVYLSAIYLTLDVPGRAVS